MDRNKNDNGFFSKLSDVHFPKSREGSHIQFEDPEKEIPKQQDCQSERDVPDHPRPKGRGCSGRLIGRLVILALLVLLVAAGAWFIKTKVNVSSKTVEMELKNIGELATQAAYFTNVQTITASKTIGSWSVPGTSSNYVYSYDGVIKAGYDFGDIGLSVDLESKTVTVTLPAAKVLSCEVDEDSLKVYNETKNIYTPLSLETVNESIATMKKEATERAIERGLYTEARKNAETIIKLFLSGAYNPDEYTFVFKDAEGAQ